MKIKNIILTFLYKYFFILKAASDGWCISYVGGNRFKFDNHITYDDVDFKNKYKSKVIEQYIID
jgi:hypothetical protein